MNTKTLEVVLGLKNQLGPGIQSTAGIAQRSTAAFSKLAGVVRGLVAAFLAMAALRQVIRWMGEAIRLAKVQEAAIKTLNAALAASGQYSLEASQGLQEYATRMQALLGIGDEVTLETMGIVEGLTRLSAEALPQAMDAVIQFSSLYGGDFKNAAIQVGKTLISGVNSLTRYGIEIDMTADAQGRLNQIIEATSAGMAIAIEKSNSYEGATTKLSAAYGDLLEKVGDLIIKSPAVIEAINILTNMFIGLGNQIKSAGDASDDLVGRSFVSMIGGILQVARTVVGFMRVMILMRAGLNELATGLAKAVVSMANFVEGVINNLIIGAEGAINLLIKAYNTISTFIPGLSLKGYVSFELINLGAGIPDDIVELEADLSLLHNTLMMLDDSTDAMIAAQNELNNIIVEGSGAILSNVDAVNRLSTSLNGGGGGGGGGGADGGLSGALNDVADAVNNASISLANFLTISGATPSEFAKDLPGREARYVIPSDIGPSAFMEWMQGRPGLFDPTKTEGLMFGVGGGTPKKGGGGYAIDWASIAATGIGGYASGGGAGAISAILPAIGMAIGGPIGGAIGGFLGGLFGKKKKPRGETKSNPVYTYETNQAALATALLNITAGMGTLGSGMTLDAISDSLRGQSVRLGTSS